MNLRKISVLFLSLSVVALMLGACQNRDTANTSPAPEGVSESQSEQADTPESPSEQPTAPANEGEQEEVSAVGYIHNFSVESMAFDFDPVEWITGDNTERIQELNLDPDTDLTNGFYVYNPEADTTGYSVSEGASCEIIDWSNGNNGVPAAVSLSELAAHLDSFEDDSPPFTIVFRGNEVISITEIYTP